MTHFLWEAIADLSHCKELRDNFPLTQRLPKGILESFVPPQQPDVRVDSQQLIGPPAAAAAANQPSKYDQRNRQYLAQRAANLTLALKIRPVRCRRPGLCSFPFVCLLRWRVARAVLQIDTFTSGQGFLVAGVVVGEGSSDVRSGRGDGDSIDWFVSVDRWRWFRKVLRFRNS
uniref:Uncharacterized protein n=1 Tax=Anopheles merus TaxID=30066 RepID=A0A182UM83_ANOME